MVYHFLVKNNKGEERELINFLPLKKGGGLFERGHFTEDLQYAYPLDGDLSGE